ncbi:MAG: protein-tyrosine-phosphatase [Rhodothermia bacterium]|nr:protein-tyrosine-phosphatase [Rhodothermia bacterium]
MFPNLQIILKELSQRFEEIPLERKIILQKMATYIQSKINHNLPINLVFICTHNSRRSHFGQIAAAVSAQYYHIKNVYSYSGGTEETAFHPNAIHALRGLGFKVSTPNEDSANPIWVVNFGEALSTTCFSKVFNHPSNPKRDFAAIMTCSDADQNCPVIFGADLRIGTSYQDPKSADGTPLQNETYQARFLEITTEILYAFSLVNPKPIPDVL